MTFGIDVSGFQAGIDFVNAREQGVEFVIVKASGFNTGTLYVASGYHAHIDRAVEAGLPKGHYYLIGGGQVWKTPTEQAKWFVDNLYRFDKDHDVLMLDNEGLDSNGYLFDDAESAEFMTEVIRLTGIPPRRVWHYAGARDYRSLGPWPLSDALGARFVWAAYGDRPTGQTPDHEPSLQGSIPYWDVHQFTSSYRMPGYNGALDGNYSHYTVDELFGGNMALNNYVLRAPSTVILADNRDPWVSWRNHLARTGGLRGGVDIVAPVGTPVYARTSGVMLHVPNDGSAGNSCRFQHDANPGWRDVFSHLSAYVGGSGQHFNAGEIVAYTGNSGGVAPHLHWHLVDPNGNRRNPWDYFSSSSTAGGGGTIIEEFLMALTDQQQADLYNGVMNMVGYLYKGGVSVDLGEGSPGSVFGRVMELQRQMTGADGFYTGINAVARIADIQAKVGAPGSVVVDIDALAQKISSAVVGAIGGEGTSGVTLEQIRQLLIDHVPTEFIAK